MSSFELYCLLMLDNVRNALGSLCFLFSVVFVALTIAAIAAHCLAQDEYYEHRKLHQKLFPALRRWSICSGVALSLTILGLVTVLAVIVYPFIFL